MWTESEALRAYERMCSDGAESASWYAMADVLGVLADDNTGEMRRKLLDRSKDCEMRADRLIEAGIDRVFPTA